jgi:hypothetical protein
MRHGATRVFCLFRINFLNENLAWNLLKVAF